MQNNEPMNQLFQPRMEGEMDLISEVRKALIEAGIGAGITAFDNDPNIIFAKPHNSNVQRFKLNTWLDTQYQATGLEVSDQRSMLLDNGTPQNWLEVFVKFHIPSMKALGLPMIYR